MVVTREDVLAVLYPEEPNYEKATLLGPEALPYLDQLAKGDDPGLAAKAASLSSLIQDQGSLEVLRSAAQSKHVVVRVAAALGSKNLKVAGIDTILESLVKDTDESIRKHAAKSLIIESITCLICV